MTWIQPFEMQTWIMNVFSGSPDIFLFLGIIMITSLAAYFKMSLPTYGIFILMFALIMTEIGSNLVLIIIILVLAPMLFWWIRRIVE